MFTYLFDGFLRRVFSLLRAGEILYMHNALAWRHGSFLSKILSAFFTRSLGIRSRILSRRPHLRKLIFFTPLSADGRRGLFPLWDSSQSFSFYLLLPLSGDSLGLLYVPLSHSLSIRSQSANICWFPFLPGFVTSAERDWPRFLYLS